MMPAVQERLASYAGKALILFAVLAGTAAILWAGSFVVTAAESLNCGCLG